MTDLGDAIQRFIEEPDALEKLIEQAKNAPLRAREVMRKHDLAIESFDDPYQKLAFTFYDELVKLAQLAEEYEAALLEAAE